MLLVEKFSSLKGGCHDFQYLDHKCSWHWDWMENVFKKFYLKFYSILVSRQLNFTPFWRPRQPNFTPLRCPRQPNFTTFWGPRQSVSSLKTEWSVTLETSDSSLDHRNFPCPFCTKIFDEKAEVVNI